MCFRGRSTVLAPRLFYGLQSSIIGRSFVASVENKGVIMKLVEAIIKPFKLEEVKEASPKSASRG